MDATGNEVAEPGKTRMKYILLLIHRPPSDVLMRRVGKSSVTRSPHWVIVTLVVLNVYVGIDTSWWFKRAKC
jgi:hypothetical protein